LKAVITGASGLLGAKLAELATEARYNVYSLYNSHPCSSSNAEQVDITDEAAVRKVFADLKPDVVFHAASLTDVDLCERDPKLAMKVNGEATGFIAKACQETGSYLVYVSTDYVFDGMRGQYSEEDEPAPINAYGRSKLLGEEEMARHYPRGCVARTSVVYGWGRPYRPNFATWVHSKLAANEPLRVVNGQFASPTLNTHLARMLLEVAELRMNGILHVAGSTRISRYDFAVMLAKQFGFNEKLVNPIQTEAANWKARRPVDSSLNVSKAHRMLSSKPVALDQALREFAGDPQRPT
jgi:dTDP-4-dehydrorhamnose reductase